MIWLSWRQQRTELLLAGLLLCLLAALFVPTGLNMAAAYQHDRLAGCLAHESASCASAIEAFRHQFSQLSGLFPWFNFLPGLLGILLAAPFVLELEQGTYRLAWTQSITRRRWLTTKLAVITLAALSGSLLITLLVSWWRQPLDHLDGRLSPNIFDFEGTVPFAYTLFAVCLLLALGVILRRAAATIGLTLGIYIALRIAVQSLLRPHYQQALSVVWSTRQAPNLRGAWIVASSVSDRHGHPYPNLSALYGACARPTSGGATIRASCLQQRGAYNHLLYQPASRFWLFQGLETAIFAGLALALLGFVIWWITQRSN